MKKLIFLLLSLIMILSSVSEAKTSLKLIESNIEYELIAEIPIIHSRRVRATTYNALPSQTDSTPNICAWGDRITPDVIAVSRDLEKLGLGRNVKVYVEGQGLKVVKDRMHKRKKNQVDVFMKKYKDAMNFGVQYINIYWVDGWIKVYEKSVVEIYQNSEGLLVKNKINIEYKKVIEKNTKNKGLTEEIINNLINNENSHNYLK